jgi:hypothetical protein
MAGSFLSPGLSAASGNFGTGLRFLCALTVVSKLLNNGKVYQVFIDIDAEDLIFQFDLADFFAFHI